MRALAAAATAAVAACGVRSPEAPSPPAEIRIVGTERGPSSLRLVVIDEHGDRLAELMAPAATAAHDHSAAFSPDGRWVAFVSTRGRGGDLEQTSLWIVPAAAGAQPHRLTTGDAVEMTPAWTPDGKALVIASSRDGTFDLWRIAVDLTAVPPRAGEPVRLTHGDGQELSPSIAPDGRIAYTALRLVEGTAISRIEVLAPDGAITQRTPGPFDSTPAWSPDGTTLAFASLHLRDGGKADQDIWLVDRSEPRVALDAPDTDESGPVWSRDGHWLFSTSTLWAVETPAEPAGPDAAAAKKRRKLFSAIVHVDLRERPRQVRMLVDRAGAVPRLAPALAPAHLDEPALRRNPEYRAELGRILRDAYRRTHSSPEGERSE